MLLFAGKGSGILVHKIPPFPVLMTVYYGDFSSIEICRCESLHFNSRIE
jgi:hypothetical protein